MSWIRAARGSTRLHPVSSGRDCIPAGMNSHRPDDLIGGPEAAKMRCVNRATRSCGRGTGLTSDGRCSVCTAGACRFGSQ